MSRTKNFTEDWLKQHTDKMDAVSKHTFELPLKGANKAIKATQPSNSVVRRPKLDNGAIQALYAAKTKFTFFIDPIGKPRLTQADKWHKRERVTRYWHFKAELIQQARLLEFALPDSFKIEFFISTTKVERWGKPHQQKPDIDNICKAVFDSLSNSDQTIWNINATKIWGENGKILITIQ